MCVNINLEFRVYNLCFATKTVEESIKNRRFNRLTTLLPFQYVTHPKVVAQSAVVIWTSSISTKDSPSIMTAEVLEVRPWFSHPQSGKVDEAIGNQFCHKVFNYK